MTVATSADFALCTAVWAQSLRAAGTRHRIVVLALEGVEVDARALEELGATVLRMPKVANPAEVILFEAFRDNFAILRVWELDGSAPWAPGVALDRVVSAPGGPGRRTLRSASGFTLWDWGLSAGPA